MVGNQLGDRPILIMLRPLKRKIKFRLTAWPRLFKITALESAVKLLMTCIFLFVSISPAIASGTNGFITNTVFENPGKIGLYRVTNFPVHFEGREVRVIRQMQFTAMHETNHEMWLCLDPETLTTFLTDPVTNDHPAWPSSNTLLEQTETRMLTTGTAIGESRFNRYSTQAVTNVLLTTDLCPTRSKLNRDFYQARAEAEKNISNRIPCVVFFSGEWIRTHPADLDWLKTNGAAFTAGNHTWSHHIIQGAWPRDRFTAEITNTEVEMLENGILPSCWFRFPGLKFGHSHLEELSRLSLIPLDCGLWMGQKKVPIWPVILLHSNGTTDIEVRMFRKYLAANIKNLRSGKLVFNDFPNFIQARLRLGGNFE